MISRTLRASLLALLTSACLAPPQDSPSSGSSQASTTSSPATSSSATSSTPTTEGGTQATTGQGPGTTGSSGVETTVGTGSSSRSCWSATACASASDCPAPGAAEQYGCVQGCCTILDGSTATTGSSGAAHSWSATTGTSGTSGVVATSTTSTSSTGTSGTSGTSGCMYQGITGSSAASSTGGVPGCSAEQVTTCSDQKVQCTGSACVCSEGSQVVGMVTTPTPSDCVSGWSECFSGITGSSGTTGSSSPGQGSSTPLVFIFDGQPVEYTNAPNRFELSQLGSGLTTAWPSARTPWLVLDRARNGTIDDGRELFGAKTVLPDGRVARDGFEALSALDSNGDGVLDARDAAFPDLRLWADRDQDRRSGPGELTALTDRHIESVSLRFRVDPRCDDRGNCEVERAPFLWRDREGHTRTGEVVDIHLANRIDPRAGQSVASR